MATKQTKKTAARKATAKKTSRRPKSKVAVHESVDAEATEVATSSTAAPAKKRARVERDLPPGTVLKRQFKGREIEVEVVEGGFQYQDQTFKSISAVARRITGYGISGPLFFRLGAPEASDKDGA